MIDDAAWMLEERLWLDGAEAYREFLHAACIMAFPGPVGIMQGAAIIRSIAQAPRWDGVRMTERAIARPAEHLIVLAYRADGRRAGADAYAAYCMSTYCREGGAWKLVQHQQTPIGQA